MNGVDLFNQLSEGHLLAVAGNEGRVHLVFADARTGKLRICRPAMLQTTHSKAMAEWVEMGHSQGAKDYIEQVRNIGRKPCGHCLSMLDRSTNKRVK
jgi:hypothetical protein